jgi:hypothetical protein
MPKVNTALPDPSLTQASTGDSAKPSPAQFTEYYWPKSPKSAALFEIGRHVRTIPVIRLLRLPIRATDQAF